MSRTLDDLSHLIPFMNKEGLLSVYNELSEVRKREFVEKLGSFVDGLLTKRRKTWKRRLIEIGVCIGLAGFIGICARPMFKPDREGPRGRKVDSGYLIISGNGERVIIKIKK